MGVVYSSLHKHVKLYGFKGIISLNGDQLKSHTCHTKGKLTQGVFLDIAYISCQDPQNKLTISSFI